MWVTVCIYTTVIGWTYSILTLLSLLQDKSFQHTLVASRFARRVARIQTPFYLVCGCGETGSLICRALDLMGFDFVILDKDAQRIEELDLEDFKTNDPALAADARLSVNLLMAGVRHAKCRGVLAVTNDDECNLAIAINVRLLNPEIPVLTRVRSPAVAENMRSFGTHHIVNAYERFAEYLALAVSAPEAFRLIEILTGLPGSPLPAVHRPPRGRWIVCGYGHFGQAVSRYMSLPGIELTIVDPDAIGPENGRLVAGSASEAGVLHEAGVMEADGIVAGSNSDVANLSIAMMAKQLNPDLYVVARQNQAANDLLFETFRADFSMVHTRVVAQECISILTTPLLARFLVAVRQAKQSWSKTLAMHLEAICEGLVPQVWDIRIEAGTSPAVCKALRDRRTITVGDLMRDNADRDTAMQGVVLMVERAGQAFLLPNDEFTLQDGDAMLLAGKREVRSVLDLTLKNANALDYILTGRDQRGGWVWRALFGKKEAREQ
jgi:Trk K+ transport system NAD-binding subunit